MSCLQEEAILDFVEGRLPSEAVVRIEQHLAQCASCSELVAAVTETWLEEGHLRAIEGADRVMPSEPSREGRGGKRHILVGKRFGRYEILGIVGEGRMGEVYRARDGRLGREVALKVMLPAFAGDEDWVRRFEHEARAVATLNHPNVLAIYDVGTHEEGNEQSDGQIRRIPYLVSELLDGETLRQKLRGDRLPRSEVIDIGLQVARGLAAAHEQNIVHRDLKPENIFVTRTGSIKILDFGLAKIMSPLGSVSLPFADTAPGAILGTIGYMSPEQARGEPADCRADIFALGAIVYEMASGRPAFGGASAAERLSAILKDDPIPLDDPGLGHIVQHCLQKDKHRRYQSMQDLVITLEALATEPKLVQVKSGTETSVADTTRRHKTGSRQPLLVAAIVISIVIVATMGYQAGRRQPATASSASGTREEPRYPVYHQFTFHYGRVYSARFTPDGHSVVYGSSWEGRPVELFTSRIERPDARSMGLPSADILAISSRGEMAVSLGRIQLNGYATKGTLARLPLLIGTPREVLQDVQEADFTPDGDSITVVRSVEGKVRIELPIGHTLYESAGWISHARVSPTGQQMAFLQHPTPEDDRGEVMVIDLVKGTSQPRPARALSGGWSSVQGLSWSPKGEEVWFTAAKTGGNNAVYAITLDGRQRLVASGAGRLFLHDISREGKVLVSHEVARLRMFAKPPNERHERELSWSDVSVVMDISANGQTLLFIEVGEVEGNSYGVYLRTMDAAPAMRLGDGFPWAFSSDQSWVLTMAYRPQASTPQLILLPTGAGEPKELSEKGIATYAWARLLPDAKSAVFMGFTASNEGGIYVQSVASGQLRRVTDQVLSFGVLSPDGTHLAGINAEGKLLVITLADGQIREIPGHFQEQMITQWSHDGAFVYLRHLSPPIRVVRVELANGQQEPWSSITPADMVGFYGITSFVMTPDERAYAYTYAQVLSRLYLVDGMH